MLVSPDNIQFKPLQAIFCVDQVDGLFAAHRLAGNNKNLLQDFAENFCFEELADLQRRTISLAPVGVINAGDDKQLAAANIDTPLGAHQPSRPAINFLADPGNKLDPCPFRTQQFVFRQLEKYLLLAGNRQTNLDAVTGVNLCQCGAGGDVLPKINFFANTLPA